MIEAKLTILILLVSVLLLALRIAAPSARTRGS